MDIWFDSSQSERYQSKTQRIRVLTETWTGENLYCPHCGNDRLIHFPNNCAVADFYCPCCQRQYELKSKNGMIGHKIADGAYKTFIQRITSSNNPDFFILSYNATQLCVENMWLVPGHFFVPAIVEKRVPLASTAKRAGWIGCNILFNQIPKQGRIYIVRDRLPVQKEVVIRQVESASKLSVANIEARGWLMDVLHCVNTISTEVFTLREIYAFEEELRCKHPLNHNVLPKIRQQLQVLRDKGYLEFLGGGIYRKVEN